MLWRNGVHHPCVADPSSGPVQVSCCLRACRCSWLLGCLYRPYSASSPCCRRITLLSQDGMSSVLLVQSTSDLFDNSFLPSSGAESQSILVCSKYEAIRQCKLSSDFHVSQASSSKPRKLRVKQVSRRCLCLLSQSRR